MTTAPDGPASARPGPTSREVLRSIDAPTSVEHDLPGAPLRRTYRAGAAEPGAFGVGFRSAVDLQLRAVDGHVCVSAATGDDLRFVPTSTGWLCTAGPIHRLTASGVGWSLVVDRHSQIEFDLAGRPRAWRTASGLLDTVVDGRGRIVVLRDRTAHRDLHLDWDGAHVVQVATSDGATASYTYGVDGADSVRLLRVVRPDGVVTYRWDDDDIVHRHHCGRWDHRAS